MDLGSRITNGRVSTQTGASLEQKWQKKWKWQVIRKTMLRSSGPTPDVPSGKIFPGMKFPYIHVNTNMLSVHTLLPRPVRRPVLKVLGFAPIWTLIGWFNSSVPGGQIQQTLRLLPVEERQWKLCAQVNVMPVPPYHRGEGWGIPQGWWKFAAYWCPPGGAELFSCVIPNLEAEHFIDSKLCVCDFHRNCAPGGGGDLLFGDTQVSKPPYIPAVGGGRGIT